MVFDIRTKFMWPLSANGVVYDKWLIMESERKIGHKAYLLLGSNLGDRAKMIEAAREKLNEQSEVVGASAIYRTEPWKMDSDQWFFNQVVEVETPMDARKLLSFILEVERSLGRDRDGEPTEGYTSRTIDIDILYFDDEVIDDDQLTIPHPRLQERRFALAPMVELAPSLLHPVLKQSQFELLRNCPDQSFLELI